MTEDDALIWIDFFDTRMFGWGIVMGIDPETGRTDFRKRRTKASSELQRDLWFNRPELDRLLDAVINGRDVADLWPETMRNTVRFCFAHKVPRAINEPTSDEYRASKREHQGEDWPAFVLSHGKPAGVGDHPPFPPRSDLYLAWQNDCAANLPADEVFRRSCARKSALNDNSIPEGAA